MPLLAAMTLLTACYFALPFWTALELKRAIRNGDAATVEARVDWENVRTSLRESLNEQAPAEARRRFSRIPFIQKYAEKFAVSYSRPVVDKMVDSFGTAQGLIRFFSWKESIIGPKPPRTLSGIASEMSNRVKRVTFASLTRLEVVMTDRTDPKRHVFSAMDHKGLLGFAVRAPGLQAATLVAAYITPHGHKTSQAKALLTCLAHNPAPSAIQQVLSYATRVKQKSLQKLAGELIADLAERHGRR